VGRTRKPTIVDVAAQAGVSRTQASDALNGRGRVDAATRDRVIAVAQALGYRANITARNLRASKTGVLAMLLPEMGASVAGGTQIDSEAWGLETYVRTTVAAASAAFAAGYALTLVPPAQSSVWVTQLACDGAIISDPDAGDERIDLLDSLGIPVVTIERDPERPDAPHVSSDTGRNTLMALDHLAERGAERIALLQPQARWAWIEETTAAFEQWSREHRREALVVPVPLQHLEGSSYEICRTLLVAEERPDAILALADTYALGALRAAQELGLSVPEQLMICAGVDSITNAAVTPAITALEIDPEGTARAAVEMMVGLLSGSELGAPVVIPGRLVVRASTGGSAKDA
jgi:DNA-binding LacI/PurR family transcriptional regulator